MSQEDIEQNVRVAEAGLSESSSEPDRFWEYVAITVGIAITYAYLITVFGTGLGGLALSFIVTLGVIYLALVWIPNCIKSLAFAIGAFVGSQEGK